MSQNFLFKSSFHEHLIAIDRELANISAEKCCRYCGGKLHQADFSRSPMGMPPSFRDYYNQRISFCCADCRKRTTPPSARFFGRRWYGAAIFVFISIMTSGISKRRLALIQKHFGIVVRESTWRRWRKWWRDSFVITKFWQQAKGQLPPTNEITQCSSPRVIFNFYHGNIEEKMLLFLRFLSPLTINIIHVI
jgi:hypothetical protein